MNDFELKTFVANLGKYNEGELAGEWVSFPTTAKELKEVYDRIGIGKPDHFGISYEEVFIADYEVNLYGVRDALGEYSNLKELNYLAGLISEMDRSDFDTYKAILESKMSLPENGIEGLINLTNNLDNFEILPDVYGDEDLGYYYVEESGIYDTKNLGALAGYIDYERFGRDICLEEGGTYTDYGYITQRDYSWDKLYDRSEKVPEEYQLAFEEDAFENLDLSSAYRYYITETALNKGSYPVVDGQVITEFMEAQRVSGSPEKIFGYMESPVPLTEEQLREYALIPAKENPVLINRTDEKVFFSQEENAYAIFQLKDTEEGRERMFHNLEDLTYKGLKVDKSVYEMVYAAPLLEHKGTQATLETLFSQYNNCPPSDYQHPSMSVGDVVVLRVDGNISAHFCDSFGFQEVHDFLQDNPLKAAEEQLEDDYNMVDGIINNGDKEDTLGKPSILSKIKEKKHEASERNKENVPALKAEKTDRDLS